MTFIPDDTIEIIFDIVGVGMIIGIVLGIKKVDKDD